MKFLRRILTTVTTYVKVKVIGAGSVIMHIYPFFSVNVTPSGYKIIRNPTKFEIFKIKEK